MQTVRAVDIDGNETIYPVPNGWRFIENNVDPKKGDRIFSEHTLTWASIMNPLEIYEGAPVIRKTVNTPKEQLVLDNHYQYYLEI